MKAFKYYVWKIVPTCAPLIKKKCSKCKSTSFFYCSNKFRLNSQKRSIDVWLIYRCEKCDTTYNLTILSRTKPELIDKQLYLRFSLNNEDTVWKYAFDSKTIKENNVDRDYSKVEYDISYEKIALHDIAKTDVDFVEFRINTSFNIDLKLSYVIKKCLNISSSQLKNMLSAGVIYISPIGTLQKHRIGSRNDIKVILCYQKLKAYLESVSEQI